jgi:hypothetical protein
MMEDDDGQFDYGSLRTEEIEHAVRHIDGAQFPKNLANARKALAARKHGLSPEAPAELSAVPAVSLWPYGVVCLLGIVASVAVLVTLRLTTGIKAPRETLYVGLFAAIHLSNWWFIHRQKRMMSPAETTRFMWACLVAFWVWDNLPEIVVRHRLTSEQYDSATAAAVFIVGLVVDGVIVAAMVYLTVPWVSRRVWAFWTVS